MGSMTVKIYILLTKTITLTKAQYWRFWQKWFYSSIFKHFEKTFVCFGMLTANNESGQNKDTVKIYLPRTLVIQHFFYLLH